MCSMFVTMYGNGVKLFMSIGHSPHTNFPKLPMNFQLPSPIFAILLPQLNHHAELFTRWRRVEKLGNHVRKFGDGIIDVG
ncbi:hypothetical protein Drorol1_Dr00021145 [Drosera rotundifolia]